MSTIVTVGERNLYSGRCRFCDTKTVDYDGGK